MSDLRNFVEERLAEKDLSAEVLQAYGRILTIATQMRRAGSWITGTSALVKAGEYVLGADAETEAARFSDQLMASLAATWKDHPDYKAKWANMRSAE